MRKSKKLSEPSFSIICTFYKLLISFFSYCFPKRKDKENEERIYISQIPM